MTAKKFLKQLQHDNIVAAIRDAEKTTSAEIRIFISQKKVADPVAAAQVEFQRLGMTKTRRRNGVLIFVAPPTRKFAVIGDEAVHRRCGDEFWQEMAAEMTGHFKRSDFTRGIIGAVRKAGQFLARHFPHTLDDRNELSDDVERD